MDPRLLGFYERELKHVREMGGEFAAEFPKVAGRLGLDAFGCADPYVERLIEAFAFLTARVQLKLDGEFGTFTQQMLELLYPNYLAPLPSMAVVQLTPSVREGSLARGVEVPRGASLRSALGQQQTACEFRTAHPVTLWPLEIESADYRSVGELLDVERAGAPRARAALRLVLRTSGEIALNALPIDALPVFLRGGHETSTRLYEQLLAASVALVVTPAPESGESYRVLPGRPVESLGFADDEALLPCGLQGFQGHRLLQEYFAFPERFMFVKVTRLREALRDVGRDRVELVFLFDRVDPRLEGVVKREHFGLFCTPAVNLFPRHGDRMPLSDREHEVHVVPDRTRPLDLEVHSITRVVAHGQSGTEAREFTPMYAARRGGLRGPDDAHYAVRRVPRALASRGGEREARHDAYVPTEIFLSLVDGSHGPFRSDMRQLAVSTLCTNRALPLQMPFGRDQTDFTEQSGAPLASVRCVAGPTPPRSAQGSGDHAWGLLSHLSLDYLTLMQREAGQSATAVRELLGLYAVGSDLLTSRKQIDGVEQVEARSVVRPLPFEGPMSFGRGLEVTLTCDEGAFEGTGVFLLGAVMAHFLAKYASINSFTETVLRTTQRGEVMRWPTSAGRRGIL